ncbi:MAG: hypothetical protein N2689_00305 [Verrucomicrobiae bacterium]|nr:hypothetical protein [Verrucomicrobiae bacterium]
MKCYMRLKILVLLVAAMGMVVYGVMDRWLSYGLGATAAVALLVVALVMIVQSIRSRSGGSTV